MNLTTMFNDRLRWAFRKVTAARVNSETSGISGVESARAAVRLALANCASDKFFYGRINGFDVLAPARLLRLYPHCLHPTPDQFLTYDVESAQSRWLCSKIRPGDTALDIGAATGLLSLAMSHAVGRDGTVYSFEPSRGTFRTLQSVVRQNKLKNVRAVSAAIGAECGKVEFIEFLANTDFTWAPDTSTMATGVVAGHPHERYLVDLTTIDDFCADHGAAPRAIKIDIEGFELDALQGGAATIRRDRPALCIDIHNDPRTGHSTENEVTAYLGRMGYRCRMEGHALYAEHAGRR